MTPIGWSGCLFSSPEAKPRPTLISSSMSNFCFLSIGTDVLIGVDDLDSLRALDFRGGHRTFFGYGDVRTASFVVGRLKPYFLEVQDYIDDIFAPPRGGL